MKYIDYLGNTWQIHHSGFGFFADDFPYYEKSFELLCSCIDYWMHTWN